MMNTIKRRSRHSLESLRQEPLAELSGALGDLGTLLPLMIGMALSSSISLSTTLVFTGVYNIVTGVIFGVPLPVQPMKAIAASAISSQTPIPQTVAAGSLVGATVLFLGATGLIRIASTYIPVPVIRGIQVGAGISLTLTSGRLIQGLTWMSPILDNRLWALGFFVVLLATQSLRQFPYALIVLGVGVAFSITSIGLSNEDGFGLPGPTLWTPMVSLPEYTSTNAWGMAAAQLPLTLLNSIIAIAALSAELLPDVPAPSTTALSFSVGIMNLVGCWFGAMPVCHGAGGLAAQVRFGARSGASIIILGLMKMGTGLVFGDSIMGLLGRLPDAVLGVMVLAAGLELAGVGEGLNGGKAPDLWIEDGGLATERKIRTLGEEERKRRWSVMLLTAVGSLGFKNTGVGFLAGMMGHWAYVVTNYVMEKRGAGTGERTRLLA